MRTCGYKKKIDERVFPAARTPGTLLDCDFTHLGLLEAADKPMAKVQYYTSDPECRQQNKRNPFKGYLR